MRAIRLFIAVFLTALLGVAPLGGCMVAADGSSAPAPADQTDASAPPSASDGRNTVGSSEQGDPVLRAIDPLSVVAVIEYMGNDVAFLDKDTGEVRGRVQVGMNPAALAFSADGTVLYVANSGSGEIVRCTFGEQASLQKIRVGTQPMALALDDDRGRLYVADYHLNSIRIVDTRLFSLVGSVALTPSGYERRTMAPACCLDPLDGTVMHGRKPVSLALSPDKTMLYCANIGTYDISRIDVEADVELDPFDGVIGFRDVVVSPDGTTLLLAGVGSELVDSPDLLVADAHTGQRVGSVFLGTAVGGAAWSSDGKTVVALEKEEGTLSKIDPATWEVVASVSLGSGLADVALSADGSVAFVGNSQTGSVHCIALDSMEVVFEAAQLADPRFLCVAF